MKNIGNLVRDERRARGISAATLAEQLGVSHSDLAAIESGCMETVQFGLLARVMNRLELKLVVQSSPTDLSAAHQNHHHRYQRHHAHINGVPSGNHSFGG